MHFKNIILIFTLIQHISRSNSFCQCENKNIDTDVFEYDFQKNKCNYISEYSELVLNNYKHFILNDNDKLFLSACVQCLLCQTIAQEFKKMLTIFHNTDPPNLIINSTKFNSTLKTFCDTGFKNFDLREYKDNRFLAQSSKSSKHVFCGVEGLWPRKLKEMCRTFMDDADEWHLYLRWITEAQKPHFDEINFLCRSYGLFQHCRNLDISAKIEKTHRKLFFFTGI